MSLNSDQTGGTAELAKQILHGDREYKSVALYPIGTGGEASVPAFDDPVEERVSERKRQLDLWDMLLTSTFRKHKGEAYTCILNSVEFAAQQVESGRRRDVDEPPPEVVFITDMIEDCPSTPLGGAVRLEKPAITKEIERAGQFPEGKIKLTNAHISFISPAGYNPGVHGPRLDELERFWRTFLSRCGDEKTGLVVSFSRSSLPANLRSE